MAPKNQKRIERLEQRIMNLNKELADLRKTSLKRPIEDYTFLVSGGRKVKLSKLFGKKKYLVLVHNMGKSCPYCTMWADGYNGIFKHIEKKAGFAVVSPDDPAVQRKFAAQRKWNFKMYSAKGSSFNRDLGFENEKGGPQPGVSTFGKTDSGKIQLISQAGLGPGDNFCSVFHFYDMLPVDFEM
ncbi:MAG TPA: DUF899 family protein [candidate division Zixibacteria bacterium]|nr:DUF899 family protein [candidate division Zixibacteria bacterium]